MKDNMYSFFVDYIKIGISFDVLKDLGLVIDKSIQEKDLSFFNEDIKNIESVNDSRENIRPIISNDDEEILITKIKNENLIPEFKTFKELKSYLFEKIKNIDDIKIEKAQVYLMFSKDNIRRGLKYTKRKNQTQFFAELGNCVKNAVCVNFIETDERHKKYPRIYPDKMCI